MSHTRDPSADEHQDELYGELQEALASIADDDGSAGAHLAIDRLIAYHEDRTEEAEAAAIVEHLAACSECSTALLDLNDFSADIGGGPDTRDELADAISWRAMRSWLIENDQAFDPEDDLADLIEGHQSRAHGGASRWWMAVAAGLFLAAIGLAFFASLEHQRSAGLSQQLAELSAPQIEVPILYLDAVTRSQTLDPPSISVAEGQRWVVIVSPPADHEVWNVVLFDSEDQPVWSARRVAITDLGTLRLSFSQQTLPAGSYRLELTAGEQTSRYEFAVRTAPVRSTPADRPAPEGRPGIEE